MLLLTHAARSKMGATPLTVVIPYKSMLPYASLPDMYTSLYARIHRDDG
jgi:hypothetical protein